MKMKGLSLLLLAIVVAVAYSAYAGTRSGPEMTRCVDAKNRVVAESFCQVPTKMVAVRGSLNPEAQYRRYFGGFGGVEEGSTAWGGSDTPLSGHVYQSAEDQPAATPTAANNVHADFYLGANHSGR